MVQTHHWKRLSGAGAAALLITGSLALVMQALVLRGDMELGAIDDYEPIDIWMDDKGVDTPVTKRSLPVKEVVAPRPTYDPTIPRTNTSEAPFLVERPTVTASEEPVLTAFPDVGSYPKFRVQHEWPRRALDQGISGWVIVGFTITATGAVTDAQIIDSSHGMFESKALKAVGSYNYEPTVLNGKVIPTSGQTIRLVWQISDS